MNSLYYAHNMGDFIFFNKMFRKIKENQVFFIIVTDLRQPQFCM